MNDLTKNSAFLKILRQTLSQRFNNVLEPVQVDSVKKFLKRKKVLHAQLHLVFQGEEYFIYVGTYASKGEYIRYAALDDQYNIYLF